MTAEAAGIFLDYSKNRITDETVNAPDQAGRGIRAAIADRRHVSRRQDQRHGETCGLARGAAGAAGTSIAVDGENVVPRGACRARQNGGFLESRP